MTEKEGMNMEKTMKMFEVRGKFRQKGEMKNFTKNVSAPTESAAAEKTMALFGSNYKIKRRHVFIEELKEARKE